MITGRFFYILSHAVKQSKKLTSDKQKGWLYRWRIVADMMLCYHKYRMYTNEYLSEHLYEKNSAEKALVGEKYREKGIKREMWIADFERTKKFLSKYTQFKYEKGARRAIRNRAYMKFFHTGENLYVEYNVNLCRQHGLDGELKIGNNVLLANNVYIDYSGEVVISDRVKLSAGVTIESHSHKFEPGAKIYKAVPTKIVIEDGVWIGQRAVICEECKRIGRFAQIGAGSVVRNPIPPYSIVVGNPAKIVGFLFTPQEMRNFEEINFPYSLTDIEKYEAEYNKYFINRINDIKRQLKN